MELENPRPTKKRQLAAGERQRAVRACDECRRLKEKCEGGMPCKRCRHLRRTCEFNNASAPTAKRAQEPMTSSKDLKERVKYMEAILHHHLPQLPLDIDTLRRTCESLPTWSPGSDRHSTSGLAVENTAHPSAADSPGIEDEKCTVEYVDDTTAHYSGEFSHWNFSMHIKRNIDELIAKSSVQTLEEVKRVPDFFRVPEPDPGSTSIADIIALIPPRPVATFLVNVFFRHATSFYYCVDKHWVKETLEDLQTNSARLRSKHVPAACVVLMVLAVSTQYVHLETSNSNGRRGRRSSADSDAPANWELDVGSTFYRQVAKSISELIHAGSLLSVQAFLLLGFYSLPLDASGLGYIYLNLAVKVAIQNGMHRRISRGAFDARSKEIRRRIWWTVYCMERSIGIYHGRPASISRSDIDCDLPSSSTPNSIDGDTFDATGLLESIDLTCQAEAFLHQISQLRTCPRQEAWLIMDRLKQMKTKLPRPWAFRYRDISSPLMGDRLEVSESRARLHAHLECCLLHMFIGRPFILAHRQVREEDPKDDSAAEHSEAKPEATPAPPHMRWNFLVEDCIAAANEAINICHGMQIGSMGLSKASYAEYSACRASLLVLIAYSICRRTNEFSSNLQKGLNAIREMASVGDSARSEVLLLETLEAALNRLQAFDIDCDQSVSDTGEEIVQDGYEGLRDWYTKTAGAIRSRASSSIPMASDGSGIRTQGVPLCPQPAAHGMEIPTDGIPESRPVDDYPFNLDLFNIDGNIAFFTSGVNNNGNVESELFENFLNGVPRHSL
ncbi:hypothetical protein COCCADRAFT_101951 [Bipolaris zeicola 26-R-13]|uniref:Zn(2)-C6 fungal-type domain-containing protein n=1 Tax=Cochliobolus carbonum (strain 26-R-13) TaxID=930089 RepID=W6Y0U3_COCC2|nr:uncharacterized protein COCCADRAFT_101951 [Bipolaris zeicola 26-R-13]EUC31165.1 hypothetical protein COCCADRAFT_101951 [Bipolaris zeicola 26-R-13]